MSARILITTPVGNVGLETLRALNRLPERNKLTLIAASRIPEKDQNELGPLTDALRSFDFADPASTRQALKDIDRVLLVRPPQLADVKRYFDPLVLQMKEAGVRHVVFLSLQGVENNTLTPHHKLEVILRNSGLDYTFLRPGFFMQNLSTTHRNEIARRSEIYVPAGHGRTSFIDVRDIAEVAALALAHPDAHRNQAYELTGSEALTYDEVAAILSETLGRKITYRNPSIPAFIWRKWWQEKTPLGFVFIMTALYSVARLGKAASLTDTLPRLTGHPPITFRQFAEDYRSVWQ